MSQIEIDITPQGPDPGDDNPKTLRQWLFGRLLHSLEAEAKRAAPKRKPDSCLVPAGMGPLLEYYEARARQMTWTQAARHVRWAIETREEYLIRDSAAYQRTPSEAELECARHHDACTVCMAHEDALARMQEEIDRLEAVRGIHVDGIFAVLRAAGVYEPRANADAELTVEKIVKHLKRVSDIAYKRWQKRGCT